MVSFRMFAGTNVGLRDNNEDNFTVCPDLTKNEWIVPADYQQVIQLGKRGCVMVVADGMGGQNAGEVASAIAIDTVQELLSPNSLPADVLEKSNTIKQFLKKVIAECDVRIKKKSEEDSSTYGMGSTIVISWLISNKLYVAWLGDSRAYSFLPEKGIARLSKDHSYVQQLVDAGTITEDEAMVHPNNNVITRSLGDTSQKAKADVMEYDVEDGQIILLCSDGLCGVCKDEEIGGIIEEEKTDLQKCKESLTTAALAAGGSDNITISLLQISIDADTPSNSTETTESNLKKVNFTAIFSVAFGLFLLSVLFYVGHAVLFPPADVPKDSIIISVDKDVLSQNEQSHYHVFVSKEALTYDIIYDQTLLTITTRDSLIARAKTNPIFADSTTCVKVICKQDSSVKSSVFITLKKIEIPEIIIDEYPNSSQKSLSTNGKSENGGSNNGGTKEYGGSSPVVSVSLGRSPDSLTQNKEQNKNNQKIIKQ